MRICLFRGFSRVRDSLALLMSPPCSPAHAAERRLHPEKQIRISKATVVFALCPFNTAIGSPIGDLQYLF